MAINEFASKEVLPNSRQDVRQEFLTVAGKEASHRRRIMSYRL